MKFNLLVAVFVVFGSSLPMRGQEFSVRAVDWKSGKNLEDIPITLRYNCGSGTPKFHCSWITRKTDKDGIAHFPEAGSLTDIDDIYSLPITYGAVCCDIQPKVFPGTGTIRFKRRNLAEIMHWIFIGN
jgi:hypothetical protein